MKLLPIRLRHKAAWIASFILLLAGSIALRNRPTRPAGRHAAVKVAA